MYTYNYLRANYLADFKRLYATVKKHGNTTTIRRFKRVAKQAGIKLED